MLPSQVLALAQSALMLVLTIAGPLLLTSLIVGTIIGLLQALTQIQETTLTFVPKLLAMGLVLLLMLPTIGQALNDFMTRIGSLIVTAG
ncbi:flagellar biosynthetic protein FliQ [Sphingomonas sp. NPDC092331]|jgi:flagellar biosynthesis protein FliQ|uniref:flagellar biosynthetic protein FliQ n=1 Tax=unclassified Sphingomonas TaxID=196159 RepID=UPI0024590752|nr:MULTISPECIES: flagellar biosynthetic protein FliQ [unclassified Sphingomonas]MBQ1496850.1 flagellar biosynthetic protein FliQ [Sphingomonas sp.]MCH7861149.1 flagellar biosynthetic protein FliQ [Pseudomonadota bacterium]MDH4743500.1 flagellar biosynthetic protein FliQ [Sphingomonas sp. CBMAI 2297]